MLQRSRTGAALFAVGLLLVAAPVAFAQGKTLAEHTHVVVLHVNDVHGQVLPRPATWLGQDPPPLIGGLARVAAYVNEVRAGTTRDGSELLVLDAGDWFQGTPEGLIDSGRAFVHAYALIGFDAMLVGNHEFDYGVTELLEQLDETKVPALLSNVRDEGEFLPGTEPFAVFERGPLRIAVVGLLSETTPEITDHSTRELTFLDPIAALAFARIPLAAESDWILPLTHLGIDDDVKLARATPDLDVIVGGHSHTYLKYGQREGQVLIVQAGSKASSVGRLDLWFDRETKQLVEKHARIIDLYDGPAERFRNHELEAACAALVARTAERMKEVVGALTAPLERTRDPVRSSTAGSLITDVMRAYTGADVAVQNRGGIRADVQAGSVTRRDLFEILPFGNHVVTVTLSGAELEALVRRSIEGGAHSALEFSGMQIGVQGAKDEWSVVRLTVGGEELERKKDYRVVTNNFVAGGGDGYVELTAGRDKAVDTIILRELLARYLAAGEPVTPPTGERFEVLP